MVEMWALFPKDGWSFMFLEIKLYMFKFVLFALSVLYLGGFTFSISRSSGCVYYILLRLISSILLSFATKWLAAYFQNKLVDTIHFMEILNLKDSVEKDTFFRKLPNLAEQLPRQIVLKKVSFWNYHVIYLVEIYNQLWLLIYYLNSWFLQLLPLLASALEFGSAAAPALTALLKMGSWLSIEEFSVKVIVCFSTLCILIHYEIYIWLNLLLNRCSLFVLCFLWFFYSLFFV